MLNINNQMSKSIIKFITIQNNLLFSKCVLLYPSFVRIYAYANVFKTTIIKQNIKITLLAGVPSNQALPGYPITAPKSVCAPDVIGALACKNQKKMRVPKKIIKSNQNEQTKKLYSQTNKYRRIHKNNRPNKQPNKLNTTTVIM